MIIPAIAAGTLGVDALVSLGARINRLIDALRSEDAGSNTTPSLQSADSSGNVSPVLASDDNTATDNAGSVSPSMPATNTSNETAGQSGSNATNASASTAADIIAPNGNIIGESGNGPDVRVMTSGYNGQTGIDGAQALFNDLTSGNGAVDITPAGYKGTLMQLPNGDIIGIRPVSQNGQPSVDVNINGNYTKFKFVE